MIFSSFLGLGNKVQAGEANLLRVLELSHIPSQADCGAWVCNHFTNHHNITYGPKVKIRYTEAAMGPEEAQRTEAGPGGARKAS